MNIGKLICTTILSVFLVSSPALSGPPLPPHPSRLPAPPPPSAVIHVDAPPPPGVRVYHDNGRHLGQTKYKKSKRYKKQYRP